MKWEFINRVKTKLFLITTFALPFFMGAVMYLPTLLMDLEPEDESTRLSGIKYSRYANLSFGDNEITHDGDGKKLDEYVPSHKRRVKSYGFFKNEYYDD